MGRYGRNRSHADSSGAGEQSQGQGFWNPRKKLSVAGDEAVRGSGASPQRTLPAKQKSLS